LEKNRVTLETPGSDMSRNLILTLFALALLSFILVFPFAVHGPDNISPEASGQPVRSDAARPAEAPRPSGLSRGGTKKYAPPGA
jgi:hypothetical protein